MNIQEQWISELQAAGWERVTLAIWRAPSGGLYRGPFAAWVQMKKETQVMSVDVKQRAAGERD